MELSPIISQSCYVTTYVMIMTLECNLYDE
jgi:hypothetical protein